MKVPVKDHDNWFKDERTGAVQCANTRQYNEYMRQYRESQKKKVELETLQNEVSELKSDMSDIKSLLLTLVQSKEQNHDD